MLQCPARLSIYCNPRKPGSCKICRDLLKFVTEHLYFFKVHFIVLFLHSIWVRSPRSTRPKYFLSIFCDFLMILIFFGFILSFTLLCCTLGGKTCFLKYGWCKKNMKFRKSVAPAPWYVQRLQQCFDRKQDGIHFCYSRGKPGVGTNLV